MACRSKGLESQLKLAKQLGKRYMTQADILRQFRLDMERLPEPVIKRNIRGHYILASVWVADYYRPYLDACAPGERLQLQKALEADGAEEAAALQAAMMSAPQISYEDLQEILIHNETRRLAEEKERRERQTEQAIAGLRAFGSLATFGLYHRP